MTSTPTIDDIGPTSSREVLFSKIRELWGAFSKQQDERLAVFAKKEAEIRRKYAGRQENLIAITATSTDAEWREVVDFLENWEEEMPVGLWRIYDGGRIALGIVPTADPAEPVTVEEKGKKKGGSGGKS